jgi:polygalacturonase
MSLEPSRRDFLRTSGLLAGLVAAAGMGDTALSSTLSPASADTGTAAAAHDAAAWRQMTRSLARVRPPRFSSRVFDITRYGAVPDGTTKATDAIAAAIADCTSRGGGRVLVPAGTFLTGAVHLKSNVELHLAKGATLLFSQDPADYLPVVYTRWQGIELMNYSPFIYAFEQENIAVTGEGTLDGQADNQHWWPWKGKKDFGWVTGMPTQDADDQLSQQMADDGVPVEQRVFGAGHYLRPMFIQPYRCRNVLIQGVTILRSPMWEINPVLCQNVAVLDVTVNSHGPNNDGCDPESCRYVLIDGCSFSTGDDCIALKAGKNADGRRVNVPCEDVIINNCTFADGHGGVTIGSEMTGGVRNVYAQNLQMSSPNLQIALRLKTNSLRGGFIENVYMRNTTVGQVSQQAFLIDFFYEVGDGWTQYDFLPVVEDISLTGVTVGSAGQAYYLVGYPTDHIQHIRLTDCTFTAVAQPSEVQYVDDLVLTNVVVNGQRVDAPAAGTAARTTVGAGAGSR